MSKLAPKHPRLDSAIVVTEKGLEVVGAAEVPRRTRLMTREHAEETLAALTKDPVEVVVRRAFGPGAEA